MMNARMTIGRRRSFEEYELWASFTLCNGAVEDVFLIPYIEYALVGLCQIQAMMFGEFLCHNLTLFIIVLFFRAQRYIKNSYPQRNYHLLIQLSQVMTNKKAAAFAAPLLPLLCNSLKTFT
jgi:hypothetical protein